MEIKLILQTHIENYEKTIDFIKKNGGASPSQIAKLLGVSKERGRQILAKLREEGLVRNIANGVVIPTQKFYEQFGKED